MQNNNLSEEKDFKFLVPYFSGHETIFLLSGKEIKVKKYFLNFKSWNGKPLEFDFGRKPVLDWEGEACFAELAILKLFQKNGWHGAWVETYGGKHYLDSMPDSWSLKNNHIQIPEDKAELIDKIQKAGKTSACFDVVAWKDGGVFFCEAKRLKKDRLTDAQKRFIEGALSCGVSVESFLIIEWGI